MNTPLRVSGWIILCVLILIHTANRPVHALTLPPIFHVTSTADVGADPSDLDYSKCRTSASNSICTLRAAIEKANHFPGGGITIRVPALAAPGVYGLSAGNLVVQQTMDIVGEGAGGTIIDGSANGTTNTYGGDFQLNFGTIRLSGLTIQGGYALGYGGGISAGPGVTVTLDSVVVRNNFAEGDGGGISSTGLISVRNSAIISNTALSYGGGFVLSSSYSQLLVQNSTISGNRASGDGGGIVIDAGTVNLFNVTMVNNTADADVNGDNIGHANSGGAIVVKGAGVFNSRNSILTPNYGTYYFGGYIQAVLDCSGTINSTGSSIIGPAIASCTYAGSWMHSSDTKLDVLKYNGGQTPTHALLPGSPALDAGESPDCTDYLGASILRDQRGFGRPANGGVNGTRCDIGAVEMQRLLFLPIVVR